MGSNQGDQRPDSAHSELIIIGSGSSTGVPTPACVIRPSDPPCTVCHKAIALPPERNPNYRCNPSMVIKYQHPDGRPRYIQIDAGKCFKEQVVRWFVRHKIPTLDALILTHEHADAILGLDDIRGIQPYDAYNRIPPMPVYLTQHSMASISDKFPYLVPKPEPSGPNSNPGKIEVVRRVTQLTWHVIEEAITAPFEVCGLEITPLPVKHGEDYTSLGFLFGRRQRVAYISDVSRIPPDTEKLVHPEGGGPVDLLILDALYKEAPHNTHVSLPEVQFHLYLPQSLEIIKRLRPRKALLIGMTHEFDHEVDNAELADWSAREGLDVRLSYDGLSISIDL